MIAVIGGLGRIGRRYRSLLAYMGEGVLVYDTAQDGEALGDVLSRSTHCILATPTETHLDVLSQIPENIPVLVEKPVAKHADFDASRPNAYTVCNYKFVFEALEAEVGSHVVYDYYNSGPDGLHWDCCQLIHLDKKAELRSELPFWTLLIDNKQVPYTTLEKSYLWMLQSFIYAGGQGLWSLEDGRQMTESVLEYEASHSNTAA